jgi:FkbM family methyltransferase
MIDFADTQDEQYFDSVLNLEDGEVFVDVGGFDGYTSSEFARRCPRYNAIHFFEPDKKNLTAAKLNLSNLKNVHYYQYGLSSKKSVFRFSSNGSSSHISDKGGFEINVDKLDDLLDEPYTFLKMDIEGAEGAAIDGAKESILRHHPKLAISVYHKVDDFWKIPLQILSIREDYKIYMRHYTEGFTETVMFFIPIK